MRSSVFINEIDPTHVAVDLTMSPASLVGDFAYQKTMEQLGLEVQPNPAHKYSAGFTVEGSTQAVKENIPHLKRHIGLIARYGAQSGHDRDWMGRILGRLTQETLPNIPEDARLLRTVGAITYPFADVTNDDGVSVYYHPSDEFPTNPFATINIGGLEIDRYGDRAEQTLHVSSLLNMRDYDKFMSLKQAQDEGTGNMFDDVLRRFLDKPDRTEVTHLEAPLIHQSSAHLIKPRPEFRQAVHNLSRETMARLWEEYHDRKDLNTGDILRAAIKDYVTEHTQK